MPLQDGRKEKWYHAFEPNKHATHKNTNLSCVLVILKKGSRSINEISDIVKKNPNSDNIEWHFVEFEVEMFASREI